MAMMTFIHWLQQKLIKFINTGADKNSVTASYIRLTNINGLIYFILDLLLAIMFYLILDDNHISIGLAVSAISFLIGSIGFNYLKWTTLSRLSTVSIGSIIVTYGAFFVGSETFVAAILLLGAIFPFVYFSTKEKIPIAICLLIPLICYALLVTTNYNWGPHAEALSHSTTLLFQIVFFLIPFIGIVVNTYLAVSERENKSLQLEESKKLLEIIFHGLAHDLGNSIFALWGLQRIAMTSNKIPDNKIPLLIRSIENISNIFSSLKDIASLSEDGKMKLQLSPQLVNILIQRAVDGIAESAQKKSLTIELSTDSSKSLEILVNANIFIYQVLTNLLTNAIKFSEIGARIQITTTVLENTHEVQIEIRDWGLGIEQDKIPNLFHWNRKTSTEGTLGEVGTGLGLPLAYKFIQSMNASLVVTSNYYKNSDAQNKGTRTIISLPIHHKATGLAI